MTPRSALGALHIGALMFGLTGVFGKLAAASPAVIVFGRAAFAVVAKEIAVCTPDYLVVPECKETGRIRCPVGREAGNVFCSLVKAKVSNAWPAVLSGTFFSKTSELKLLRHTTNNIKNL